MARDRVYVSEQFKNTMDELKKADVLGLSLAIVVQLSRQKSKLFIMN